MLALTNTEKLSLNYRYYNNFQINTITKMKISDTFGRNKRN